MNLDTPELHRIRDFLQSVKAGYGTPEDPRQKGEKGFFPGLTARPWHDAADWATTRAVTRVLEAHADTIRAEYERAEDQPGFLVPHPASSLHPALKGRDWGFRELWRGGRFRPRALRDLPGTCAVLREIEPYLSPAGQVAFHRMEPGARLRPHADGPNTTLTCHLGIDVPEGCWLRVAGDTRSWEDGRCLWFDHSFEHDAANDGTRARTVLLLDVIHPDITAEELACWRTMWERRGQR